MFVNVLFSDVCPLGHISVSGLVPCYPCAESTYQDELGQKACKPCPEGSSSAVHGSTSVLSCISGSACLVLSLFSGCTDLSCYPSKYNIREKTRSFPS